MKFYPKQYRALNNPAKFTIITKGRRAGATQGSLYYILEQAFTLKCRMILFVDRDYSNIKEAIQTYLLPFLKELPDSYWRITNNYKTILIYPNTAHEVKINLRSATNPRSIEGYDYDLIIVNEAGIVFDKNDYLFKNTIKPLIWKVKNGRLIISGTPKGKNAYYRLYRQFLKEHERDPSRYAFFSLTPYDNDFLEDKSEIIAFEQESDTITVRQEVYGEFVEDDNLLFCYEFKKKHIHLFNNVPINGTPIHVSFDFNVSPMTCLLYFYDGEFVHVWKEFRKENSDIYEACRWVLAHTQDMLIYTVTGDASGNNRSALTQENATYYNIIRKELKVGSAQMKVPKSNITHTQSRIIVNSAIRRGNVTVSPECKHLLYDIEFCNITPDGRIDKSDAKRGHLLDCFRYILHLHYADKTKKL